jgi:hypothetical protein
MAINISSVFTSALPKDLKHNNLEQLDYVSCLPYQILLI